MTAFQILPALPSDMAEVERLSDVIQEMHADARPDVFRWPVHAEGRSEFLTHAVSDPTWHFWVAKHDAAMLGYLLAERMIKDGPIRTPHVEGHIHQICVAPQNQRQGVGRALVAHACQFLDDLGVDRITVAHWTFNTASTAFFEAAGFDPIVTTAERKRP